MTTESLFFTSDTHFRHVNIIDYCKARSAFRKSDGIHADGLPDPDAMDEELMRRWNAAVPPGATVFHLGDFAFKLKSKDPAELLKRLHGEKVLIWGNHDLLKGKKDEATRQFWLSRGFRAVHDSLRMEVDGKKLYLHHEPMPWTEWQNCDIHLCGHVHDAWAAAPAGPRDGRIINVGVDVQDLRPKTLQELLATGLGFALPVEEFRDGIASSGV